MNANQVIDTIYSRKSIRSYDDKNVPDDVIKKLIDIGFHAANGMNTQSLRFSVVSNKKKLDEYSDKGKALYLEWMKSIGMKNEHLEAMLRPDAKSIFYDAPAAIFIFVAPGAATPVEDASLAAGNIMIAARSIGLGTCWIGLGVCIDQDDGFKKDNNIPDDHKLAAVIILGYPKNPDQKPTPRGEPQILGWVR